MFCQVSIICRGSLELPSAGWLETSVDFARHDHIDSDEIEERMGLIKKREGIG